MFEWEPCVFTCGSHFLMEFLLSRMLGVDGGSLPRGETKGLAALRRIAPAHSLAVHYFAPNIGED